jgi:hypothetical protein
MLPYTEFYPTLNAIFILDGGIRTKVGTCSYHRTFEQEWSSQFLIWAAENTYTAVRVEHLGQGSIHFRAATWKIHCLTARKEQRTLGPRDPARAEATLP